MNKLKNKMVGRWNVVDVYYSIVTKRVVVIATCIKCGSESKFEVIKIKDINDLVCDHCDNRDNEGKLNKAPNISKVSLDDASSKIIKSERDRYILDKLKRVWKSIIKNEISEEWKNSFDSFELWSNKNNYRTWKVLDRYDNSKGYNKDNCYWRLDNKGIPNNLIKVIDENTLSNSVKHIKDISYKIEELRHIIGVLNVGCKDLLSSNYILNKGNVGDCVNNIRECEVYINKCSELIDKIDLKM